MCARCRPQRTAPVSPVGDGRARDAVGEGGTPTSGLCSGAGVGVNYFCVG